MKVHYIVTPKDLPSMTAGAVLPIDIETANFNGWTALDPNTSVISLLAMEIGGEIYIWDRLAIGGFSDQIKDWLLDPKIIKVAHNVKFEYGMFKYTEDLELSNIECTMLLEQVLKNGIRGLRFGYENLVYRYEGVELDKTPQKSDWGIRPLSIRQLQYSANDVAYLRSIYTKQHELLSSRYERTKDEGDLQVYRLELDVIPAFAEMEHNGVYFEKDSVLALRDSFSKEIQRQLEEIQSKLPRVALTQSDADKKKMRELYPDGLKPPTSVGDFKKAYKALGVEIPTVIKDKGTKETRESLSKGTYYQVQHETGPMLAEYFANRKLLTSYINPILGEGKKLPWINPYTGRVHPSFRSFGAQTGRPTCSDPALQTIPRLKEFRNLVEAQDV